MEVRGKRENKVIEKIDSNAEASETCINAILSFDGEFILQNCPTQNLTYKFSSKRV